MAQAGTGAHALVPNGYRGRSEAILFNVRSNVHYGYVG